MFLSFSNKNLKLCNKYFVELFFEILILSSAMNAESVHLHRLNGILIVELFFESLILSSAMKAESVRSAALTIFHLQSYFSRV